jgi:hypothetical protein
LVRMAYVCMRMHLGVCTFFLIRRVCRRRVALASRVPDMHVCCGCFVLQEGAGMDALRVLA